MTLSTLSDVLYASQGISSVFSTTCCDRAVRLSALLLSNPDDNKEAHIFVRAHLGKLRKENDVSWFSVGL